MVRTNKKQNIFINLFVVVVEFSRHPVEVFKYTAADNISLPPWANAIKLFKAAVYNFCNKLECSPLASFSRMV